METQLVVPKNCAILFPMEQTEKETISYIKNMQESEDLMGFDDKFGHSIDAKIADVLWLCSSMFSSCGKQIRVPEVFWFTNEELPHDSGSADCTQAFQRAKDLQQLKIEVHFNPLKLGFDGGRFYKDLLSQLANIDQEDFEFPTTQLNEKVLVLRTLRRGYSKRAQAHLTVEISPQAKFGVGIYTYARKTVVPTPISTSRGTNQPIVAKRSYKFGTIQDDENGNVESVSNIEADFDYSEKLEVSMAVKYQQCGGESIKFTPLEAYEIKQVMDPKIKVLGFKPRSVISERNHIKAPYFIYPNDSRVKNSTVFFRALWEQCLEDKKVIICTCTMKLKSHPRLVALVPQKQPDIDEGELQHYDGFQMVFIPFAGDIRDLSEVLKEAPLVDGAITNAMKTIVGKLRIIYEPHTFENPSVKRIYKKIEEQLFESADEEMDIDYTLPKVEAQDDRVGAAVDELESLLEGFEEKSAPKRKAGEAGGEPKRKKVSAEDVNEELILQKVLADDVKNLTVPMLKAFLELRKITGVSKMTKPQCIEKIKELGK